MPLPNSDQAHIDRRKLAEYLLNRIIQTPRERVRSFAVGMEAIGSVCETIYSGMPRGRLLTLKKPGTAGGTL